MICVGSFAAIDGEPRQARKGATVTIDSGAEILLAQVAANNISDTMRKLILLHGQRLRI